MTCRGVTLQRRWRWEHQSPLDGAWRQHLWGFSKAWTWLHFALRSAGHTSRLSVIQRTTVDYLAPITRDFEARCPGLPAAEFEEFLRTLDRYGKARATLAAVLTCEGGKVAAFSGDYVAAR